VHVGYWLLLDVLGVWDTAGEWNYVWVKLAFSHGQSILVKSMDFLIYT